MKSGAAAECSRPLLSPGLVEPSVFLFAFPRWTRKPIGSYQAPPNCFPNFLTFIGYIK